MRLVLYNIRYATGAGPLHHMPVPFAGSLLPSERRFRRIQTFLDTLHPDIVVLVEADRGSYRCGGQGQAEALEKSLEKGSECSAVLQQIAAIRGAVNGLMLEVLEGHLRDHLGTDVIPPEQRKEDLEQVVAVLRSYLK